MVEFKNKILFVGFGAVAQCTLPILEKHIKVPLSNITVMDFENQEGLLKDWVRSSASTSAKAT
jgi:homospermidine synthase